MKKMGGLSSLLDKLPAQFAQAGQLQGGVEDKAVRRIEGIINSMTLLRTRQAGTPQGLPQASDRRRRRACDGAGRSIAC